MRWLALALSLTACTRDVRDEPDRRGDGAPVVWDAKTGARLSLSEVEARLAAVDVVLVGEEHGNRAFHDTQREVAAVCDPLGYDVIAVEWIGWHERERIAGSTIATVEADLGWSQTWGHDFASYRPIFEWAFTNALPIVGVNARRELARALSKGGRDAVPPELAAELTPLDSATDAHRAWFADKMAAAGRHHGHAMPPEAIERYYLAQMLWDETMAAHIDTLADETKVVAFAGLGHTERALGIAARLRHRFVVVRPVADEADAWARVSAGEYPEREADLLWRYPRSTNTASR